MAVYNTWTSDIGEDDGASNYSESTTPDFTTTTNDDSGTTVTDSSDYDYSDPRTDPDNWDSDSGDSEDVTGGGVVDDDTSGSGWGDDDSGSDTVQDSSDGDEYLDDPRNDPTNWESDSGDASDVTGGGRVDPEDDEWAQAQDSSNNAGVEEQINNALAEQRSAFEEDISALMEGLPIPDQLGGSSDGGGLSPALGAVALLAVGGGALYYSEAT